MVARINRVAPQTFNVMSKQVNVSDLSPAAQRSFYRLHWASRGRGSEVASQMGEAMFHRKFMARLAREGVEIAVHISPDDFEKKQPSFRERSGEVLWALFKATIFRFDMARMKKAIEPIVSEKVNENAAAFICSMRQVSTKAL